MTDGLTDAEEERWRELHETPHDELSQAAITSKIKLSVKRRYSPPEWQLGFEIPSPDQRRVDAVAVNTFPSRNFKIIGFEFKASRSDWLNEKRDGAKADYFIQAVDEWYVVAGDTDIVETDELPEGWGLLELKPNSERLYTIQESSLTEYQAGDPDRAFWGRFLKTVVDGESNYTQADLDEARRRGYEDGYEDGKDEGGERADYQMKKAAEQWEALQEAGLADISRLSDKEIRRLNDAYRIIAELDEDGFRSLRSDYEDLLDGIDRVGTALSRLQDDVLGDPEAREDGDWGKL